MEFWNGDLLQTKNSSNGVLNDTYARERLEQSELIFRYKVRARVVAYVARKYLTSSETLRILDFGSADGLTLLEVNSLVQNADFWGLEYSEELVRSIRDLPPNIKILQGDVIDLPHEVFNSRYDLVSALAILEHLVNPLGAIKSAARVLRRGGVFIATCPNPFWDKVSRRLGLLKGDHHEVMIGRNEMIYLAREAGLSVLEYKRFMWAPIAFLPYLGIRISPDFSLRFDSRISNIKLFNFLFINQYIVAQKK